MAKKGGASFKPIAGGALGITGKLMDAATRGLVLAGHHVLEESNRIVPVDENTLRESGAVVADRANARAAVTYSTPYAVVQHEDLSLNHPRGGEAKFLEKSMNGSRDAVREIVADSIRDFL